MLLPDAFGENEEVEGNGMDDGEGDLGVLLPDDSDDTPPDPFIGVGDGGVLAPDDSDDVPSDFDHPVGDGDVQGPNDTPEEDIHVDGDGTLLQRFLSAQSDATIGVGFLGTQIFETNNHETDNHTLGDVGEEAALPEDGIADNGEEALGLWNGSTPPVDTGDDLNVINGGAGHDTFWIYHDTGLGTGYAEVTNFTSGEDFLRISLNPELASSGTPDISVAPSEDGSDGVVTVNGDVVAVLRGAPGATVADVYVDMAENIFK